MKFQRSLQISTTSSWSTIDSDPVLLITSLLKIEVQQEDIIKLLLKLIKLNTSSLVYLVSNVLIFWYNLLFSVFIISIDISIHRILKILKSNWCIASKMKIFLQLRHWKYFIFSGGAAWYLHDRFRHIIRDFTLPKFLFLSSKLTSTFSTFSSQR